MELRSNAWSEWILRFGNAFAFPKECALSARTEAESVKICVPSGQGESLFLGEAFGFKLCVRPGGGESFNAGTCEVPIS